jgi:hypothetical protein
MKRIVALLGVIGLLVSCSSRTEDSGAATLKAMPLDGSETLLTASGVTFDADVSSDGNGSVRLEAEGPTTFRIAELDDIDLDNARIIYSGRMRTENVSGKAYLEMWCVFPELGEYFSRGLQDAVTGTVDWTHVETPFLLQAGQKPSLVKLNVVVDGTGTVWVDDIRLAKGRLR